MPHSKVELSIYLQEARELLVILEDILLHGKNDVLSVEQIHAAFRTAHTMKGSASIYEFNQIVTLTHNMESLLEKARSQPDIIHHGLVALLLSCVDFLSYQVDEIEQKGDEDTSKSIQLQTLIDDLQAYLQEKTPAVHEHVSSVQQQTAPVETSEQQHVRIDVKKLDHLIDLIGELVIASASNELAAKINRDLQIQETAQQITTLTTGIRETALSFRMVRIHDIFQRFPRIVREMSRELDKEIELSMTGDDTELDKAMMENVANPLMHLIRNAVDHGIETIAERIENGKSRQGHIAISARHESGSVVIEVDDDGRGLNIDKIKEKGLQLGLIQDSDVLTEQDIIRLVFVPGFSTAEHVTALSGRGVGMDAVKEDIEQLHGTVSISSVQHEGTKIQVRIPLTLSMIEGFLVTVGDLNFVIPLDMATECINLSQYPVRQRIVRLRDASLPIIILREMLQMEPRNTPRQNVVILHDGRKRVGLLVDGFSGECHVVIKPMNPIFRKRKGLNGTTILGDGRIAFILDIPYVMQIAEKLESESLTT